MTERERRHTISDAADHASVMARHPGTIATAVTHEPGLWPWDAGTFNPSAPQPRLAGSATGDTRRRAHWFHTCSRRAGCDRKNGFPNSDRCGSACSPTRQRLMGIGHAPRARSYIGQLQALPARRRSTPVSKGEVATMETASLIGRRAQALGPARERSLPTSRRRSPGASGIATETAATSGRRSFPPPSRPSIGWRRPSSHFGRPGRARVRRGRGGLRPWEEGAGLRGGRGRDGGGG